MVSDITYIYVKNYGWTYLATVEDLCSRAIIGYSYGKTIDAFSNRSDKKRTNERKV